MSSLTYNSSYNILEPRAKAIFGETFKCMGRFDLTDSHLPGLNFPWLPRRNFTVAGQSIAIMAITTSMKRSQRLLLSLEDLCSDIVHGNRHFNILASVWKADKPHNFFEWSGEGL